MTIEFPGAATSLTTRRAAPATEEGVAADVLVKAMRAHPAGVTIVTLDGTDGPVGFTASSPSSLSASPALLSFNIGISSSSLGAVLEARTAVIHLLGEGDEPLALRFAGPAAHRFADTASWTRAETGEPLLLGGRVRLRVGLERHIPAGDHVLVIARVLDAWFDDDPGAPLVVLDGGFHPVTTGAA